MKRSSFFTIAAGLSLPMVAFFCRLRRTPVQRIGMVIGIKPRHGSAYEALHAVSSPGVRDLLTKYHIHNFSIFIQKLEGDHYYLFGYYEYTGSDYKGDMERFADEPRNQQWLSLIDPMQLPLPGERSWSVMREIYCNP
ncbi:MAG: L-rhamnose mutarotase [Silvibacterium sp.]